MFLEENVFFWPAAEDLSNPKIEAFFSKTQRKRLSCLKQAAIYEMIYAQKIRSDTEFVNTIHNVR